MKRFSTIVLASLVATTPILNVHPTNTHFSIRVVAGKPHSPHPHQQKPYVIQMKNGKAIDKHGNLVPKESPEAHVSLEEFIYRD